MLSKNDLLSNLGKVHTTKLGIGRIKKNLGLDVEDVVVWCREKIEKADDVFRKGKNWYVNADDCVITVNAHSFTIITAHKHKFALNQKTKTMDSNKAKRLVKNNIDNEGAEFTL